MGGRRRYENGEDKGESVKVIFVDFSDGLTLNMVLFFSSMKCYCFSSGRICFLDLFFCLYERTKANQEVSSKLDGQMAWL